jgi:hypothetical protein
MKKNVLASAFLFFMCDGMQDAPKLYQTHSLRFAPSKNTFTVHDATGRRRSSNPSLEVYPLLNFVRDYFLDETPQHSLTIAANLQANGRLPRLFAEELLKIQSPVSCGVYVNICNCFAYIVEKCKILSHIPKSSELSWVWEIGGALCNAEKTRIFLQNYSPLGLNTKVIENTCLTIKNDATNDSCSIKIYVSKEEIKCLLKRINSLQQI